MKMESPLDADKPYYEWGTFEGRLTIYSECCADSFSIQEEEKLLEVLQKRKLERS